MIKLEKFYFGKDVNKKYKFEYDKKNKKRPSWLRFYKMPENLFGAKITINEEEFWYRRHLADFFIPLDANEDDYEIYYDFIADKYEQIVPHNRKIADFIVKKLRKYNINKKDNILEIGSGTGLASGVIVKNNYRNLTLMDISSKVLEIAKRKKILANCKFIKSSVLKFKSKEKFKVIYNSMALNYFSYFELDFVLKLIKENLVNNGLFISVDRHIYDRYGNNFKKLEEGYFYLKTELDKRYRYYYFIGKI